MFESREFLAPSSPRVCGMKARGTGLGTGELRPRGWAAGNGGDPGAEPPGGAGGTGRPAPEPPAAAGGRSPASVPVGL